MLRDRVKYVPAGLETWPGRMGQMFVKLERNEKISFRKGQGYKIFRLRDRTLYLVYESTSKHRLIDEHLNCDYMVPYQNPAELRGVVDRVLVNPVHAGQHFRNVFRPHGLQIISDSGGFQLLSGVSTFIHPDTPISFYNQHRSDIGMPLDLPMKFAYENLFFDAATGIMKENDKYMIPRLTKYTKLALVSHGSTLEMRKRRLDAIWRPTPVVAIAGVQFGSEEDSTRYLSALSNALYVISQTRNEVEYFHFLGVTSRFWFIIYAILSGTGYVKSCGGDSVSHRMAAITGLYKNQLGYTPGNTIQIEKQSRKSVNTSCTCPICQAVGDLNVLTEFQLCECHLIWYSEKEKDLICDSVQSYLDGHLTLKQIADQWLNKGQHELLRHAVDYVERVVQKGFFSAQPSKKHSLFDLKSEGHDPAVVDHYKHVIKNYEDFYKKRFLK